MIRATSSALLLFLLAATGCMLYLTRDLHQLFTHADGSSTLLMQRWTPSKGKPDAAIDAFYNLVHATNDNLNRPCGGGKPCGTLAALDKTVTKIGDSVVTTQLAERTTVPHVVTAMDTLNDAAGKLGTTADAATVTLGTTNSTIEQFRPVLGGLAQDSADLDALLKDNAIHQTLAGAAATLDNANGILADGRKVADKAAADFLRPIPWWKQPIAKGGELIDIGAAIARHTP